ncbi:MAG TPA: hypothetical protein VMR59_03285 [Patescibacteria group bacterium]|jgi:hypothetical protein|nr:hypothetical protein [Patescibacteria group bacterium]
MKAIENPFDAWNKLGNTFPFPGLAAETCQQAFEKAVAAIESSAQPTEEVRTPCETTRTQAVDPEPSMKSSQ